MEKSHVIIHSAEMLGHLGTAKPRSEAQDFPTRADDGEGSIITKSLPSGRLTELSFRMMITLWQIIRNDDWPIK